MLNTRRVKRNGSRTPALMNAVFDEEIIEIATFFEEIRATMESVRSLEENARVAPEKLVYEVNRVCFSLVSLLLSKIVAFCLILQYVTCFISPLGDLRICFPGNMEAGRECQIKNHANYIKRKSRK